ncbi:hypothetical protein SUGI_0581840 [Cryptomeria japonica]|nr:hypothetical protein SUGI_0581840 [Cryptomeria japonica]
MDSRAVGNSDRITSEVEENAVNPRKRVVVLVDESPEAKLAVLWALSHVVNDFDTLILLYVISSQKSVLSTHLKKKLGSRNGHGRSLEAKGFDLAYSLEELSRTYRPQVQTEVVVEEGDKGPTIVDQVKKLKASVLVLGQKKPSLFQRLFHAKKDRLVDYCIANTKCSTFGVRKRSSKFGGYIINSRKHKNFRLLA